MQYTDDDGVISSKLPVGVRNPRQHFEMFGLYRGVVIRSVYPNDPGNSNRQRMEYVVRVRNQTYPNVINMQQLGGVYNHHTRIRRDSESSTTGEVGKSTYNENLDGEIVFVMFIAGHGDIPIIIGADQHPKQAAYKLPKSTDGVYEEYEFQGVEFKTSDDGTYTITQVGKKDVDGGIENPTAVGAQIKLGSNGDIQLLNQSGSQKVTLDATGILVQDKNGNKAVLDSAGILALDKSGNKITMDTSGIDVKDKNGNDIKADSSGIDIKDSNGNDVKLTSGGINLKGVGNSINGGVVTNNTVNNDPITGIPLTPVGGIITS